MKAEDVLNLGGRYLILLLLGAFQLSLFYAIFTPLTVFPVFWVLSLIDSGAELLAGNVYYFDGIYIEIIPACVAGAAYYLLLILNLTTPMDSKQRTKSVLFLLLSFLFLNVLRIIIFSNLAASGSEYFDIAHNMVWYFGSTVMVVMVWFVNVWLFKIREIPVYSDIKNIFRDITGKKKVTTSKQKKKSKTK
jgi:exosortase/archaeosortase family protein